MGYLSSPLWMMLLLVGFALTLQATLIRPEYFSRSFQLFPDWPRFDAPRMTALFLYTMIVLFTPKMLGLLRTVFSSRARRGCGGVIAVGARRRRRDDPVRALCADHDAGADPAHHRDPHRSRLGLERAAAAREHDDLAGSLDFHWPHLVIGIVIGVIAFLISPTLFLWLTPTLAGLLLAVPLSKISGSVKLGRFLGWFRVLRTPEEKHVPAVIRRRDELLAHAASMPTDGLRYIARNRHARYAHISGNLPRPQETRGHPDPHRLTAERKLADARTLNEVLAWLGPAERVHVAGDARLFERLSELPDN